MSWRRKQQDNYKRKGKKLKRLKASEDEND